MNFPVCQKLFSKEKRQRIKATALQIAFYIGSSLAATGIDWCVFLLCRNVGHMGYHVSFSAGKIVSGVVNFLLNNFIVFKSGFNKGIIPRGIAYAGAVLLSLFVGNALGAFFVSHLGMNDNLAKLVTDVLCFFLNYFVQKKLIFKRLR